LLFNLSVVSNSLKPHGLKHSRLPCPIPSSWACTNPWPSSQWYLPIVSSSVIPFSSCLLSFPGSGFFMFQLWYLYMTTGKTKALTIWTFVGKVMSLLFNMLSIFNTLPRFAIIFIPRNKCLLISYWQSLSTVILEPKKIKSHFFHCCTIYLPWSDMGLDAMIFVFWILSFKPAFSLSSFSFTKRLFSSSSLYVIRVCQLYIRYYWYFSLQS